MNAITLLGSKVRGGSLAGAPHRMNEADSDTFPDAKQSNKACSACASTESTWKPAMRSAVSEPQRSLLPSADFTVHNS